MSYRGASILLARQFGADETVEADAFLGGLDGQGAGGSPGQEVGHPRGGREKAGLEVMYGVVFDELVLKKDFKRIDLQDRRKVVGTIRKKLTTKPKDFGRLLRGELSGFWRLRAGEYRVIYETQEDQVLVYVVLVGLRRDEEVYKHTLSRLGSENW